MRRLYLKIFERLNKFKMSLYTVFLTRINWQNFNVLKFFFVDRGLDNHWICKPWNLARAIDSHVTSNLNYILRLRETGPKVCFNYLKRSRIPHLRQ